MLSLTDKFVPVLVDGDVDKEFGKEYSVSGYPHTVFTDPRGKKVEVVRGYVETASFLDSVKAALKKIGPVRLKKAAKDLEDHAEALAKAQQKESEKRDWRAVLKEVAAIEKIDHPGAALDAAKKARDEAVAEASKRLDAAKALVKDGKTDEAKKDLRRIASDFEGLDAAVEARNLVKELEAPPPGDGGGGGGDKDKGKGK